MKENAAKALFAGLLVFFGYQYYRIHIVGGVWLGPPADTVREYRIDGVDGRKLTIGLLPGNWMIARYEKAGQSCDTLIKLRGSVGQCVAGRLWHVDHPRNWIT